MKNKLTDLNNHLFAELERLSDEDITDDQLERELKRAKAVAAISVNENDIEDTDCRSNMTEQLDAMVAYRDVLQYRIEKGYY